MDEQRRCRIASPGGRSARPPTRTPRRRGLASGHFAWGDFPRHPSSDSRRQLESVKFLSFSISIDASPSFIVGCIFLCDFHISIRRVKMGSIELPYIKTDPKIIFFTDFDGTITLKDSRSFFVSILV
jgi:hypothetical protein